MIGTVVALQEVQARKYSMSGKPGAPDFWDDGNPKMNIRMGLALPNGSLTTFTFPRAGKAQKSGEKPSVHMTLYNLSGHNMLNLIGKTIQIVTWPVNPQTGQAWGVGNPRLFDIQIVNYGPFDLLAPLPYELTVEELYANDGASGGQPNSQPQPTAPANIVTPVVQPVAQPTVAPVAVVPVETAQPVATVQPITVAQPVATTVVQPTQPVGMDPNVAAAMQQLGATNIQPVADSDKDVYGSDIPF